MAEGDAVHRIARRLDRLAGRRVERADLRTPRLATADLRGWRVEGCAAVGKHLLLRFDTADGPWTLHSHLRVQGNWTVLGPGKRLPRAVLATTRALLHLDDGRTLAALDVPVLELVPTEEERRVVGHLGPDLLDPDVDVDAAAARLAVERRPLVEVLLDQRVLAGPGNLWAVEACFLRGAWPWLPAGDTDATAMVSLLVRMMRHSLEHATRMTTTGDRRRGRNHWVYGRAGRPCLRCGTPIAFRPATGRPLAREVWWCPHCQAAPGGAALPAAAG